MTVKEQVRLAYANICISAGVLHLLTLLDRWYFLLLFAYKMSFIIPRMHDVAAIVVGYDVLYHRPIWHKERQM